STSGSAARRRSATCSACQRASALPRVAMRINPNPAFCERSASDGDAEGAQILSVVEVEELAEGGDEAVAAGGLGGVLEGDRRLVQQLADDAAGEALDGLGVLLVDVADPAAEPLQLGL